MTHRQQVSRTALFIFGMTLAAGVFIWGVREGLSFSDEGWKAITSISLAIIAAGFPVLLAAINAKTKMLEAKMNRQGEAIEEVRHNTNSLIEQKVEAAEASGKEAGRAQEVERVRVEDLRMKEADHGTAAEG